MKSATKGHRLRKKRALLREYFLNALTLAMLKERSAIENCREVPEARGPELEKAALRLQNV